MPRVVPRNTYVRDDVQTPPRDSKNDGTVKIIASGQDLLKAFAREGYKLERAENGYVSVVNKTTNRPVRVPTSREELRPNVIEVIIDETGIDRETLARRLR